MTYRPASSRLPAIRARQQRRFIRFYFGIPNNKPIPTPPPRGELPADRKGSPPHPEPNLSAGTDAGVQG